MAYKTGDITRIDDTIKATLTNVAMPTTGVLEVNTTVGGGGPTSSPMQGTVKGMIAGGEIPAAGILGSRGVSGVESFPFSNESNVFTYASLKVETISSTGHSSATDGYTVGGYTQIMPAPGSYTTGIPVFADTHYLKSIDKVPFSNINTCTFVGNLSATRHFAGGHSSPTTGFISGGGNLLSGIQTSPIIDTIPGTQRLVPLTSVESFPFAIGEVISSYVGDLAVESYNTATHSNETHGFSCQNSTGLFKRTFPMDRRTGEVRIDRFPFSTSVTSIDIGDAIGNIYSAGISAPGPGFGYIAGYFEDGTGLLTGIQKYPFASGGFSAIIGGLSQGTVSNAGLSSSTNGYSLGGTINTPGGSTRIERFPFATDTNASYIGDLTQARITLSCSFQD
jgi:hypothetical protein